MSDSEPSDVDDDPTNVQRLVQARLGAGSDEEISEEEAATDEPAPAAASTTLAAPTSAEEEPNLPSALDVLDPTLAKPDFLHVAGPAFDASKTFKPPPMTAAKLGPVSERHVKEIPTGKVQRVDPEYNWGKKEGEIRLRGSVCFETDDERGRRVRYGAHAMLKADPWSACNPNYSMSDSSVTRGMDRGGKRKL
ncbi:hypothetical protein AB1Y20_021698 [Prymnesium parvum]|uniref:Uncharacterized protein n=1 Tax=Prymnesium parvum TaxID=97485 RepID=A0AB34JMD0_PRYPA|mmetsp:Transcript_20084/g.48149  ORF Transcript_20084/g.48149 Transcript_20084/m.48149 type:complete len:193 (+) Transcript_20084:218-796(+)|eukprot:CAMPEP_0113256612 /NCGR_PEP_ID=MMETSP0008_2-20120614/14862_1 /TAXON_ID=97485 /ORGANISM="Prymnesium parvum" /LENGTH=192 /DNA_ID=CAMNT_0000104977 /DNA_START=201 /DNA_END=779 /DNA_ORIENTATION=- /assembly_acc=CAM_ASM_000153